MRRHLLTLAAISLLLMQPQICSARPIWGHMPYAVYESVRRGESGVWAARLGQDMLAVVQHLEAGEVPESMRFRFHQGSWCAQQLLPEDQVNAIASLVANSTLNSQHRLYLWTQFMEQTQPEFIPSIGCPPTPHLLYPLKLDLNHP